MGRTALVIAISYVVATVLVGLLTLLIARSTRARRGVDTERAAEQEKTWFVVVVVLLAALLFATILFTPYGRSAGRGAQVVDVEAVQFAWLLPGKPLKADRPVEFRLRSKDVNHNFAVYTEGWKLLFQVQVVPGKTQKYVYTFHRPGTYRVVCLEFCGLGHSLMQSRLTVTG
jgi:cytochrome c oxidase subunit II